jgi:hypothetical protein
MKKLKEVIEQYGRWNTLSEYIRRIETYKESDFSFAIENMKAMLEAIGKEICKQKSVELESTISIQALLKKAFSAVGYTNNEAVTQISSALVTIGQKIGELRNEVGITSHGKSLEEIEKRNNKFDEISKEFLISSVDIIAYFLIRNFETENPRIHIKKQITYSEQEDFNEYWDELYGEFNMGDYSYSASEILYYVDNEAYLYELKKFSEENNNND